MTAAPYSVLLLARQKAPSPGSETAIRRESTTEEAGGLSDDHPERATADVRMGMPRPQRPADFAAHGFPKEPIARRFKIVVTAGPAGHPLRESVGFAAELILDIDLLSVAPAAIRSNDPRENNRPAQHDAPAPFRIDVSRSTGPSIQ